MPTKCKTHLQQLKERHAKFQQHKPKRLRTKYQIAAQKIRGTARYQRFVAWHKQRNPLCCDPLGLHAVQGVIVAAAHTHHIIPMAERLDLKFTDENCASLCHACHNQIEKKVQAGEDTRGLFTTEANG